MRHLCILNALALFVSSCAANSDPSKQNDSQYDETYLVTRVIDGDTIELENQYKVRLIGIDTPETKHSKKEIQYFGQEAFEATKALVEGKKVKLEFDIQKNDKYGRLLAYVYLNDTNDTFVNAWLVQHGYAKIYTFPPNVKYHEIFLKLEREARNDKRGLWGKK